VVEAAVHVQVVAAILRDARGRVLLAQRPRGKDFPGLWEFPGGKCEPGEAPEQALRRELREELGIDIGVIEPLIAVPWCYPHKSIVLDVHDVRTYSGIARGREGQALRWVSVEELAAIAMPPADRPVIAALHLPRHYVITSEPGVDTADFLRKIRRVLDSGEKCIQLRSQRLGSARLRALAQAAHELTHAAGAALLVNGHVELAKELGIGVHLPAAQLMRLRERPLGAQHWVAASCHGQEELAHAATIGVDFAVLGPVQRTASHANAVPLGWERFAALCREAPFPVYALGGLSASDFTVARAAGAQGLAGISAFWPPGS